ncbi:LysR family transcriptional regulator [Enterovibrio paralichthyis]|uniref:LysR family transcriptional regulator n=1 Tax=Enterovibrio paralichthyis TaxID=2853805 RepID=UPI001C475186|nr:LysR family transcriptional regulator [Enterovibrio paralichthyis]MBV7296605.1 LysR family transcriptional regulator [Enterovibrio paralichthyis]
MTSFRKSLSMVKPISHFLAVVAHHSVTRAAEELDIAPARISESLKHLEEIWNVRLFRREGRQMKLTNAGQRAFERYHHLIDNLFDAVNEDIDPHRVASVLSVTCPIDIGSDMMPAVIRKFHHVYPDVEVKLFASDQMIDMADSNIDLAIRVGRLQRSHAHNEEEIVKITPFLAATPEIKRGIEEEIFPDGVPFIRLSRLPEMKVLTLPGLAKTIKLKTIASSDNAVAAQQMTYDGLGAGLFSGLPTRPFLEPGKLEKVDELGFEDFYAYASWPGRRLSITGRKFLDLFKLHLIRLLSER